MAQTANRTLQYSQFVSCAEKSPAVYTYTPGFDIKALALTLGPTGAKPIYLSLAGVATDRRLLRLDRTVAVVAVAPVGEQHRVVHQHDLGRRGVLDGLWVAPWRVTSHGSMPSR